MKMNPLSKKFYKLLTVNGLADCLAPRVCKIPRAEAD